MSTDKYWLNRRKVKLWLVRRNVKKFWEIELAENSYTVVAGPDGTQGRTSTKRFASKVDVRTGELLLSFHPDLSIKNRWGQSLLQRASLDEDLVMLLEKHGIATNLDSAANPSKAAQRARKKKK